MDVLPGDYAGAIEEYIPAEGTFSSDEGVYSSNVGELELDAKSHSARVKPKTRIPKLQGVGSVTVGMVAEASDSVAIIDLAQIDSQGVSLIPNGVSAVLHVSNIRRDYVKDLRDELKIGDIIRARIIESSEHTTKLTIDGRDLGVIKAFCVRCRQPLRMSGPKLVCDRCGDIENRKIAEDYGSGNLR
jgi:exosome complex component CSL4